MELRQEIRLTANRDRVYAALNDVKFLRQAIPGCEEMTRVSDTEFIAVVASKIGPIKATFKGGITLSELNPPASYTMTGRGAGGAAGFARMCATIRLAEDGDGTLLSYGVKADVGGKLAQLGGRLIDTAAKKMADQFFGRFQAILDRGAVDGEPSAVAVSKATNNPAPGRNGPPM